MFRRRFPAGTVLSLALVLSCIGVVSVYASESTEALERAIALFNDGDYLAAQEMLLEVDRSELGAEQQVRRDDYVRRVRVAINMHEKALRDLEDAETAIAEREYNRAAGLLDEVLANEYATEDLRRAARAHARDIEERDDVVDAAEVGGANAPVSDSPGAAIVAAPRAVAQADGERARVLSREAGDMVRAGRFAEAERLYEEALRLVPGYPPAVEGLADAQEHAENVSGARGGSLIERIRREDAINWQRTVAQYRDAERMARSHVSAERFDEANQTLHRARQIVESGKQFADPVTEYDTLRRELVGLTDFVRAEERIYHEQKVAETRREIEENRRQRIEEVEENRTKQVESLMEQAAQLRKDGELEAAINVLRQVVVIDPRYAAARFMMDVLEDEAAYRQSRDTRAAFYRQTRGALADVEKAKVPQHKEVTYAEDWLEIIDREGRRKPGESRVDALLLSALDSRVPVNFQRRPFGGVIERLAGGRRLNVIVNWHDLDRAGVDRNAPIDLDLPNEITLRKAFTEVLEQAGEGVVELGFDVADGVITIATQDYLDRKTYPVVYDISDLLLEIPQLDDPPMMDLRYAMRKLPRATEEVDLPWRYGDDDDDEAESNPQRDSRVRKIVELIQDTVAPDSWRETGGSIGTIQEISNQLVVTQNSASHRQISGLLDKLREERTIQIAVEALFITVSAHYLEELGMDFDVIFNAGNAGYDFLNSGQGPLTDPVLGNRLLLPRTFSQLGITPNALGQGTALQAGGSTILQPYEQAYLVPRGTGGSGSQGTPVPMTSSVLDFTNPATLPSDISGSFAGKTIGPALSLFGSFLDNIQVDLLIRATQADSRTSVVTAPRLVLFNGASAWVAVTVQQAFVAQLQPVVAQQAVAQAPETGVIDAGASLFVRATVTADRRYVMMLLAPGVTRLLDLQTFLFSGGTGAGQAFVQLPTLSAQRIQTMVSVPDGGTLLIGGQKLASETEVEAGVPLLSKIPVLKRLYSSRSMVKDEQVLLILIKPKILIHSEQEELAFPSFTQR